MLDPSVTQMILAVVLALHLAHHRLAKRHISFVEVVAAAMLCVPVAVAPGMILAVAHLAIVAVLGIGSLDIRRRSPDWSNGYARETSGGPRP